MNRRRFLWQLFPLFLLIIVLSLLAVMVTFSHSLRDFHLEQRSRELQEKAQAISEQALTWTTLARAVERDSLCRAMADRSGSRITLIATDGVVLGDSQRQSSTMDNHAGREEVAAALNGRAGHSIRYSKTVQYNSMYLALTLTRNDGIAGVLRLSVPLTDVEGEAAKLTRRLIFVAIIVAVISALISLLVARRFSAKLERLRHGAERFAGGELDYRLPSDPTAEIADLTTSMNTMAKQLAERMATVQAQHHELEAVFSSMTEGVLVIDDDQHIVSFNGAAAQLLGLDPKTKPGISLADISRQPALMNFLARVQSARAPLEEDIVLRAGDESKYLQVHGMRLQASAQARQVLVVLHDVTRLHNLEQVRRDFVANVSHELKTPVTAILGFVDTLREGAVDEPENARRFLDIIARQSYRLKTIIDDLLSLSQLEQGGGGMSDQLDVYRVGDVLSSAGQSCQMQATAKHTTLDIQCDPELKTRLDPDLMEQALINLIDNAIKYTDEPGSIQIGASRIDDHVMITIRDHGRGIEPQHLPRLFERFYRVDKARSRDQGGTGLGLAIVKHIARVHGGQVTVMSKPGDGSQFTIQIPWIAS